MKTTNEQEDTRSRQPQSSVEPLAHAAATMPSLIVGDVVVSRFGNHWTVVSVGEAGVDHVTLRNVPPEYPTSDGTTRGGPFPAWADFVQRNGDRVWTRPMVKCQCPSYANTKGPYPSGFCPDCKEWYPGIDRARAVALGHIQEK